MLKWTKKTFAAVRGNESLRIECKAQETKQLGDQKRERKTSWRHCHASFSVLLWGNIRRERKRRAIFTERFSVFAPTRLIVIVVSHRKLLRQYSKPYLCAIIYLSGTFVIRECRILEADQLVYCSTGLSPLFFTNVIHLPVFAEIVSPSPRLILIPALIPNLNSESC